MAFRVLAVEDEDITRKHLVRALKAEGYDVVETGDGLEALRATERESFDVMISDIKMPGLSGIELLERVKTTHPEIEVIMITGYGSVDSAVDAIRKGASDYVTKPFDLDELVLRVRKIHDQKALRNENLALKAFLRMDQRIDIIARSRAMKEVLDTVEGMRDADCNVLLTGESGVGKGLLARAIHYTSGRRDKTFLGINCATLTEELLASELFGHEKGAFTGAVQTKRGLIEVTDGGTLFLDEISEMHPNLQAKLLKVIEEGEFLRVGGTRPIRVQVRFIAATNRNVQRLISEGHLRSDLYYRLNIMEIAIPPLRKRQSDIEPLCRFFLEKHLPKSNKRITGISKEALDLLKNYQFPGNVRELQNIIERAIILEKTPEITTNSLPQSMDHTRGDPGAEAHQNHRRAKPSICGQGGRDVSRKQIRGGRAPRHFKNQSLENPEDRLTALRPRPSLS